MYKPTQLSSGNWRVHLYLGNLSPKTKKAVLRHELKHLERNDFYNNDSIYTVEVKNA